MTHSRDDPGEGVSRYAADRTGRHTLSLGVETGKRLVPVGPEAHYPAGNVQGSHDADDDEPGFGLAAESDEGHESVNRSASGAPVAGGAVPVFSVRSFP